MSAGGDCIVADWVKIKTEYVTTQISQRKLAEKYNVSAKRIAERSKAEKWVDLREKHRSKTLAKLQQKTEEDIVASQFDFVRELCDQKNAAAEFCAAAINRMIEILPDAKNVRDIANAIGVLIDKYNQINVTENGETGEYILPFNVLAKPFVDVGRAIMGEKYHEFVFPGGRGSTKSSFVSLIIVQLIKNNPDVHALICRKVGDTLRDSVYAQMQWAIQTLGLVEEFEAKLSPLEIVYKPTGQRIYFRGVDRPEKIKSIKAKFGYIGILWFEELDQYSGDAECRSIEQSALRGGAVSWLFKSFNPPKTMSNWANKYVQLPKPDMLVCHTTYRDVPPEWLGQKFIDDADFLKEINTEAYEHEYLGIPNGTGGNVFENVKVEHITDEQINSFDRVLNGVDWGYYPDPWAFNQMHYDAARLTLYIYGERTARKLGNRQTAEILQEYGLGGNDLITADSAEKKSVADYNEYGLYCRAAKKGPGSVDYSHKWLQSLRAIVIDPARCPDTAKEFTEYEYERTKDGEIISGYPDRDNHHIDAVRYATEEIWKRRGQ